MTALTPNQIEAIRNLREGVNLHLIVDGSGSMVVDGLLRVFWTYFKDSHRTSRMTMIDSHHKVDISTEFRLPMAGPPTSNPEFLGLLEESADAGEVAIFITDFYGNSDMKQWENENGTKPPLTFFIENLYVLFMPQAKWQEVWQEVMGNRVFAI